MTKPFGNSSSRRANLSVIPLKKHQNFDNGRVKPMSL